MITTRLHLPPRNTQFDMPAVPKYITDVENVPVCFEDIVQSAGVLATALGGSADREHPPLWALTLLVGEAHRDRLGQLRQGHYLASHYADKLRKKLPDTPEAVDFVRTRRKRLQLEEELQAVWRQVQQKLDNDRDAAMEREVQRYKDQRKSRSVCFVISHSSYCVVDLAGWVYEIYSAETQDSDNKSNIIKKEESKDGFMTIRKSESDD